MSVLLPNRQLGVRRRVAAAPDPHGYTPGTGWGDLDGPWPGRAEEGPDAPIGEDAGRTWVLAVDPAAWPVNQQDLITDPDSGQEWLVITADLLTHNVDPTVSYIRVTAHAHATAGTRP